MVCCPSLNAQTSLETARNKVILKWAPLSLFDIYGTFLVGAEIPLPVPHLSVQQEFGYGNNIFTGWQGQDDKKIRQNYFRSRSQLRYYVGEWNTFRIYFAGEYMLRKYRAYNTIYLRPCDEPADCDYFMESDYRTERVTNTILAKFGFQRWLSRRISLDIYAGMGKKWEMGRSRSPGIPYIAHEDVLYRNNIFALTTDSPINALNTGFQLGILLGRIKER